VDYYVYVHSKPSGEIFYVGKGSKNRITDKNNRNLHWVRVVEKYGYDSRTVVGGLQEWYAKELEIDLIAYYGRADLGYGPLVNETDGGDGLTSEDAKKCYYNIKESGRGLFHISEDKKKEYSIKGGKIGGVSRASSGELTKLAVLNAGLGGKTAYELKVGIHKEGVASTAAKITVENKLGIHARTENQRRMDSSKGGKSAAKVRYKCGGCNLRTTAPALGKHQKSTGHQGRIKP
jgi:hypothetical protein